MKWPEASMYISFWFAIAVIVGSCSWSKAAEADEHIPDSQYFLFWKSEEYGLQQIIFLYKGECERNKIMHRLQNNNPLDTYECVEYVRK